MIFVNKILQISSPVLADSCGHRYVPQAEKLYQIPLIVSNSTHHSNHLEVLILIFVFQYSLEMYKMYDEMHVEVKHHLRGGEGDPVTRQIFSPEELGGRAEMFNIMTLQPGESVGVHDHVTNGEAYLVLSGSVTVTDDAASRVLNVGDAEFCADGHTHSIRNHTDAPASFLALILPNR